MDEEYYSWDSSKKRIVTIEGEELTVKDTLEVLNQLRLFVLLVLSIDQAIHATFDLIGGEADAVEDRQSEEVQHEGEAG